MALIDDLEFCHCDLNRNLNELVRAVQGATDVSLLGCGDVRPDRKQEAERYAQALEAWLSQSVSTPDISNHYHTVSSLLGDHSQRKKDLVGHLIRRLRDNGYQFYIPDEEDFETTDSRVQHLEICCFNWEHNLLILLDEIGAAERKYGWHGVGRFCACGDMDPNNNYPRMLKARLASMDAEDQLLLGQLQARLEEAFPGKTANKEVNQHD